jgi:hypothetical protein
MVGEHERKFSFFLHLVIIYEIYVYSHTKVYSFRKMRFSRINWFLEQRKHSLNTLGSVLHLVYGALRSTTHVQTA